MGIDAKKIGLCIWKVLKLSTITSYGFLRKYPVFSGISMSLLLLYVYLPFAFVVLVYSSPFMALAAVVAKIYWKKKRPKPQDVKKRGVEVVENKKNEKQPSRSVSFKDDDVIIIRNNRTTISRQMSRRRNFTERNRLDLDASEKNEDIVSLTASLRELLGLTSEVEDKPKGMLYGNKSDSDDNDKALSSDQSWPRPDWTSTSGSEEQSHKCDGSGGEAESADDDEAHEDRNKAVEWTKDDQKNLMDLGVSEMERNNRLEILMLKRRARKFMRTEGGQSLIDPPPDIAPISVPRAEPSDHHPGDDSPMPGSAPPVLVPLQNPFDLPYDPLEEKPNLLGDSFQEEFTATQPKEMVYCRHVSFPQHKQDRPSLFGPYPRNQRQPTKGDRDRLVAQLLSLKGKSMPRKSSTEDLVEVQQAPNQEVNSVQPQSIADKETDNITTQSQTEGIENAQNIDSELDKNDATEAKPSESGVSSSDEDDVFNANIAGVSVGLTSKGRNFPNALKPVCSLPKRLAGKGLVYDDSSTSAEDKAKVAEHLFNINWRSSLSSSQPIASDMQGDFSDVDSPRPPFNEFLTYDGDNEKDNSSGSEDLWGATPRVGGGIEQPSSPRDESNFGEEAKLDDSDKKIQIRDLGGSKLSLECLEAEQLIETLRVHPSRGGLHKDVLENAKSIDVIEDETNSEYTDDISERQSAHKEQSIPPGRSSHKAAEERDSIEDTEGASQNLEETIYSAEHPESLLTDQEAMGHPIMKSNDDANNNDLNDVIVFEEEKKPQSADGSQGESLDSIRCEADMGPPKLPEASQVTNSRNIEDTDGKSVKPSDDGIRSSKSDIPPTSAGQEPSDPLLQDSSSITNIMNQTLMSEIMNEDKLKPVEHGEEESDVSIIEPIPELTTTVAESTSRSMLDMEGESDVLMVTVEKDVLVNHEPIVELSKVAKPEAMASKTEVNELESQETAGENKHSSEATSQALIKDSTGMH